MGTTTAQIVPLRNENMRVNNTEIKTRKHIDKLIPLDLLQEQLQKQVGNVKGVKTSEMLKTNYDQCF